MEWDILCTIRHTKKEKYNTVVGKEQCSGKESDACEFFTGFFLDQFEDPHCDLFLKDTVRNTPRRSSSCPLETAAFWGGVYMYICSVMSFLCNPMDCSPPGSSVHGIFQARMLE